MLSDWFQEFPVWVSRKRAGTEDTSFFTLPAGLAFLIFFAITFNVVGWSAYGAYSLIRLVV